LVWKRIQITQNFAPKPANDVDIQKVEILKAIFKLGQKFGYFISRSARFIIDK
jgi:hypothetical protein